MLLSQGRDPAYASSDPRSFLFTSQTADLSYIISQVQSLMRDGRHVDAAVLLSQHGLHQNIAAADASRIIQLLSECAQHCTGQSQDNALRGLQMCRDAQNFAESVGLPPQNLLPVLLVRSLHQSTCPPHPSSTSNCIMCPTSRQNHESPPPPPSSGARAAAAIPRIFCRCNRYVSASVLF
jgi:hypothetical protein